VISTLRSQIWTTHGVISTSCGRNFFRKEPDLKVACHSLPCFHVLFDNVFQELDYLLNSICCSLTMNSTFGVQRHIQLTTERRSTLSSVCHAQCLHTSCKQSLSQSIHLSNVYITSGRNSRLKLGMSITCAVSFRSHFIIKYSTYHKY
jgi:hypothetical protein